MSKYTVETVKIMHSEVERITRQLELAIVAARKDGASWAELGEVLGLSKQTAFNRYSKLEAAPRNTSRDHLYTPEENTEADKALAAMQAVAARQDLEKHHDHAAKFLDGQAPAKPPRQRKPNATATQRGYTDERPTFKLESAGFKDGVAQPGTGKGPHACPKCGSTNHKGGENQVRAYFDCTPTKYDPRDITDYLNNTGLKTN